MCSNSRVHTMRPRRMHVHMWFNLLRIAGLFFPLCFSVLLFVSHLQHYRIFLSLSHLIKRPECMWVSVSVCVCVFVLFFAVRCVHTLVILQVLSERNGQLNWVIITLIGRIKKSLTFPFYQMLILSFGCYFHHHDFSSTYKWNIR